MKARQKANQRQINWQCQHESETKSKSETDQLTVSAWKGDKKQVRDRSTDSVSMKGRQKASQRQISSQCQHERKTESKSETDQFTVSAWKGDRKQVRDRSIQCQHERKTESKSETDRRTDSRVMDRKTGTPREGGQKKERKKNWKKNPFSLTLQKFMSYHQVCDADIAWTLTAVKDNTVVKDPLGVSQKRLCASILLLLDVLWRFQHTSTKPTYADIKHNTVSVWQTSNNNTVSSSTLK